VAPSALKATNSLFFINITKVIIQAKTIDNGKVIVSVKIPYIIHIKFVNLQNVELT
jgi:hypothetical protein